MKRVNRLNSLRAVDQMDDDWDIKDIAGKKQAVIYGRAMYSYYADSIDGQYCPHLDPVDVYDFLIDPSGGGLDIEKALNMGHYGVVKMRSELKEGIKNKDYLRTETTTLLDGGGNSTQTTQETTNQQPRTTDTHVWQTQKNIGNPDKFVFWNWYTTYDGERYYLLLNETGGTAIRVEKLSDLFASNLWPYWTWAAFVDLTEFWTPSFCDYVREIFMAQNVSVNQMLDNAEQRNKPQRAVNTLAVKDLSQLKYQRGGNFIEIEGEGPVDNYIQNLEVPQIDTPQIVYNLLESIQEKASGVNAGAKGEADPNGKATIYEGNQAATADRFGLLNKSYSFGYKRFATLWQYGVKEHLTKKKAVDILGPDGVEIENVSSRDIFKTGEDFKVMVESSSAETALSELEKRTKIQFLTAASANPNIQVQNNQKAYEIGAQIAGFDEETIRQLLDTSEFGDADLMSEAERDIEDLLEGNKVKLNQAATSAYKQRFVDYMQDNAEDIDKEQSTRIFKYMDQLDPIILRNMQRKLQEDQLRKIASGQMIPQTAPEPAVQPDQGQPDPTASINQLAPNGV